MTDMKKIILLSISLIGFLCSTYAQKGFKEVTFTVDVAINSTTMLRNGPADTVYIGGFPVLVAKAGNNYVLVQGYIYNGGWLTSNCDTVGSTYGYDCGIVLNPLTNEIEPQDSGDVIGTWDCMGWFIQDVATATKGVFDLSTQKFIFDDDIPGLGTPGVIVTDGGVERALYKSLKRAITGGMGAATAAMGEVEQKGLGVNMTGGLNFTTTFHLLVPDK
jgi:hypothetical protein